MRFRVFGPRGGHVDVDAEVRCGSIASMVVFMPFVTYFRGDELRGAFLDECEPLDDEARAVAVEYALRPPKEENA